MKGHEEIERILASYRDATAEERARADAHVASCPACAARFAAYTEVDTTLTNLSQPTLPARLARPLTAVISSRDTQSAPPGASRFAVKWTWVPAAVVLFLLVALSVFMWSLESGRTPVTSTPTLTTTLTPTTISARQTEPPALIGFIPSSRTAAHGLTMVSMEESGATPAPAPAPAPAAAKSQVLLAGFGARATMIH